MSDNYNNNNQITRKDAKNCFVESLNDSFSIGKIHFAFATYDVSKPVGQRQTKDSFDFQEEKLAEAFYKLPLMKRKVLELLFIECIKPEEIASRLNCSPQYVYNQKFLALKQLRKKLDKGGDCK